MARRARGRGLWVWLRTGAGPWVTDGVDVQPGDLEAFRRHNEVTGIRRIRWLEVALLALNSLGWLTDAWLLDVIPGVQPALGEGRLMMTGVGLALVAVSFLPIVSSRLGAILYGWFGSVALCVGISWTMGRVGGPSTAWFQYIHVFLFVSLLAWVNPLHRVAVVAALSGVSLLAYFGAEPSHLADPLAASAITHLLMVALLVLLIGLRLDQARVRLYLFRRSAERASARLEVRVAEQTVHIQGLLDRAERAREDERRDLAAELHDEMGQVLTGMRLVLRAARGRAEAEANPLAGVLGQLAEMLQHLSWTVRNLLVRLRPRILDDLGLVAAAEWLAQRTDGLPGVSCDFTVEGDPPPLAPDRATAAFRILQEALTNAVRHAGGGRITVRLSGADGGLRLLVADDGPGFDPDAQTGGLGLAGMVERARACGGRLDVYSAPGEGTRVALRVPAEGDEHDRGGPP